LQSVVFCCSLLQSVAVCEQETWEMMGMTMPKEALPLLDVLQTVAVCCILLQSVAVCERETWEMMPNDDA